MNDLFFATAYILFFPIIALMACVSNIFLLIHFNRH